MGRDLVTQRPDSRSRLAFLEQTRGSTARAVDPFAAVVLAGIAVLVLSVWLLGKFYPGSGLEQIGMRTAREISEHREELEAEDLRQMLAAHNARRRARGEPERSISELELQIAQEMRDQRRRREEYLADRELDQLLDATNARRRARGEPERTRDQVEREFGRPPGGS